VHEAAAPTPEHVAGRGFYFEDLGPEVGQDLPAVAGRYALTELHDP